ncbi:MAG TPA: phosphatidylserine/phosphatidylglycerophosphate/cardiolipin synthase family protein [Thermoleophilaceae bacterium]|nr:phosphatidylserine/phosphatidylglycerophosphate/cardiolipin synthase family protein [Thermoleophilaceae bacterium]
MNDVRGRAEGLLREPVRRADLAIAFDESVASTVDVQVEGRNFFPPMLRDIASASSSVHITQFGFKPGTIGEEFATTLLAKASEGIPVRLVVDGQGSRPSGSSRKFYERLRAGGVEVCVVRATRLWAPEQLGHFDHRKFVVVDGRTGWVGGAGVEDHFVDGRFHDLFVRVTGPVVAQLQLVFVASFRWLGGAIPPEEVDALFPTHEDVADSAPATVLHNAPGPYRPITTAIAEALDTAASTLDVVNPYVADRGMIRRIEAAALRGVQVRLFVPGQPNNLACAAAQRFHHGALLDAGVRILEHPSMLHAKAFVRDGEDVLVGTCNLEAWSLKRFFEIDLLVRSPGFAELFDERFSIPAERAATAGRPPAGIRERAMARAFATISPLL